jgi:hypothetical protein
MVTSRTTGHRQFALLLAALSIAEACSMAPKVLFSEVRGVVLNAGTPVAGAVVEREYDWRWNNSQGHDRAVTGADGAFRLPVIEGRSLLGSILPHEPVIHQKIRVVHNGQSYDAWATIKHNYTADGELRGRPIRLRCELTTPPRRVNIDSVGTGFFGICDLQ